MTTFSTLNEMYEKFGEDLVNISTSDHDCIIIDRSKPNTETEINGLGNVCVVNCFGEWIFCNYANAKKLVHHIKDKFRKTFPIYTFEEAVKKFLQRRENELAEKNDYLNEIQYLLSHLDNEDWNESYLLYKVGIRNFLIEFVFGEGEECFEIINTICNNFANFKRQLIFDFEEEQSLGNLPSYETKWEKEDFWKVYNYVYNYYFQEKNNKNSKIPFIPNNYEGYLLKIKSPAGDGFVVVKGKYYKEILQMIKGVKCDKQKILYNFVPYFLFKLFTSITQLKTSKYISRNELPVDMNM